MTITFKGEIPDSRSATHTSTQRSYKRDFWLLSDSTSDTPRAAITHASLPAIGSSFPGDTNAFCRSITVSCKEGYRGYVATCEYSDEREMAEDPEQDGVHISWGTESFQRPAFRDKNGKAVVNSAGDTYNPPFMRDDHRLVCSIMANFRQPSAALLQTPDVVNSGRFTIDNIRIEPRYAKISNIQVSPVQRRGNNTFRTVATEMHIRNSTWDVVLLDAGFKKKKDDDATKRVKIVNDGDGTDPTEVVMLDGNGNVLADANENNIVYRTFRIYEEKNYIGLIPGCR